MIKNLVYSLILLIDKLYIYIQFILIKHNSKQRKKYSLINAGWGQLVQSIFYLSLIQKKSKTIIVLDYDKFNLSIEEFIKNCEIKKIYSIFIIFKKNFSQYPKKYELNIKNFCKKILSGSCQEMYEIMHNKENDFYNDKILSKYLLKKISKQKIFSNSLYSLNDQNYNLSKKYFFRPNKQTKKKIENVFNLKEDEIKNSINICIRKRNKSHINNDRTNYLRDGNLSNFKSIINYLLKNHNYKLFITGDIDELNINHKNLFSYKKFDKKISRNFYQLCIQCLSQFHILNSGGANQIMKFNNCKFLYIDCWPPMSFTPDSVILYKNIFGKKNNYIDNFKYLKMYEEECKEKKNKDSFKISREIFLKFFEAKKYKIVDNNKDQVLKSLKEFIFFISKSKKLKFKNRSYRKVSKYFQKILVENKCLISCGNIRIKSKFSEKN